MNMRSPAGVTWVFVQERIGRIRGLEHVVVEESRKQIGQQIGRRLDIGRWRRPMPEIFRSYELASQFIGGNTRQTSIEVETMPRLAPSVGDYADVRSSHPMGNQSQA